MNLHSICSEACKVVKETGSFIRTERKLFSSERIEYKGNHDMVSYVDKTAEEKLVAGLKALLPQSNFLTEEKTVAQSDKSSELVWIIDPLDGTTNFVHGVPCYCISVALMNKNEVVIGIVYEVNLDECFYAYKGGGAFLNENKISVTSTSEIKRSLIATGFPYSNYSRLKEYMEVFNYLMYETHGIRRLGSAAADLVYVACGRFEAFYEYGPNTWDVAAGALIVKEAGGIVSDFSGSENYIFGKEIIASNKNVHREMLSVVKKFFGS